MKCKECGKEYPSNSYLKTETLCKTCYEQLKPEDQSNSAMQLPELPNPSELIKRAFQNAEITNVSGVVTSTLRLTPTNVQRARYLAKHYSSLFP